MARDREIVGAAMMGMPALMPFRMFASVVLLKRIRRCIHPSRHRPLDEDSTLGGWQKTG
jgi:hypothetical protein